MFSPYYARYVLLSSTMRVYVPHASARASGDDDDKDDTCPLVDRWGAPAIAPAPGRSNWVNDNQSALTARNWIMGKRPFGSRTYTHTRDSSPVRADTSHTRDRDYSRRTPASIYPSISIYPYPKDDWENGSDSPEPSTDNDSRPLSNTRQHTAVHFPPNCRNS